MIYGLTRDRFLGGRLTLAQPAKGFRSGVDAVFLAAAVPARPGESVLELGLGVGAASLCLAARVPGLGQVGVELQPAYADLARENASANGIALEVVTSDLRTLPVDLKSRSFDHVMANPPYFLRHRGTAAPDGGRETALGEDVPLADWVDAGLRRLKPGGRLTLILKAERLQDALCACDARAGSLLIKPLAPRLDRAAELVILQVRKGGRGALRLLAPLILHEGDRHEKDGESYRPEVRDILREAAPLPLA
ncbi:MAG: methyltransferase [Rhodobacteraceae bacterium]|nr:methyltransferase [Paracoccaceae bacterium]